VQRNNRKNPNLNKVKPALGGNFPSHLFQYLYVFKEHPIFEDYISQYMEHTQQSLNEYLTFEQFSTI